MEKFICWDLDETLGAFRAVNMHKSYKIASRFPDSPALQNFLTTYRSALQEEPFVIRHGIAEVLEELAQQGFTHLVTTRGGFGYAKDALTESGILRYFTSPHNTASIYDYQEVSPLGEGIHGKLYRRVLLDKGISEMEAQERVIIVGNDTRDFPVDVPGLVTVWQNDKLGTSAHGICRIINALQSAGEGNFIGGFDSLHIGNEYTSLQPDDGLEYHLKRIPNPEQERFSNVPQIHVAHFAAAQGKYLASPTPVL